MVEETFVKVSCADIIDEVFGVDYKKSAVKLKYEW